MANPLKNGDAKLEGLKDLLKTQMSMPASRRIRRKLPSISACRLRTEVFLLYRKEGSKKSVSYEDGGLSHFI
jgi:hypothetical protein